MRQKSSGVFHKVWKKTYASLCLQGNSKKLLHRSFSRHSWERLSQVPKACSDISALKKVPIMWILLMPVWNATGNCECLSYIWKYQWNNKQGEPWLDHIHHVLGNSWRIQASPGTPFCGIMQLSATHARMHLLSFQVSVIMIYICPYIYDRVISWQQRVLTFVLVAVLLKPWQLLSFTSTVKSIDFAFWRRSTSHWVLGKVQ